MSKDSHSHARRSLLKGIGGVALGASVAGCVGDINFTPGDGEGSWPPPRDQVEFLTPTNEGSTRDLVGRYWANYMQNHYPDDVSTNVTATPGGQGIVANNDGWNASPDGGTVLTMDLVPMLLNQIQRDEAQYTASEFESFAIVRQVTRGVQVSHHSTGVQEHWEWDYDTLIDNVIENNFTGGAATGSSYLFYAALERLEPRLEEGDLDVVTFNGGGELRSAVQRGEIDWYAGGFTSNYNRADFYKTQIAVVDERYSAVLEKVLGNDENAVTLPESGMDPEPAETFVDMMVDAIMLHLPPETPDEIVQINQDTVVETAEEEPALEEEINSTLGPGEFVAVTGEEVQQQVQNKEQVMTENADILPEDFS